MPLFEYQCPKCLKIDELLVSQNNNEDFTIVCEECNKDMIKLISTGGFILKGNGWYKPSKN